MLLNGIKAGFAFTAMAMLVGCATTYDPKTSSTARVRARGDSQGNQLELMAIDGLPMCIPWYGGQFWDVDSGKRQFIVRYQGFHHSGTVLAAPPIPLLVDLKAGHDYEITGKYTELAVGVWVKEIKTGKPVGPAVVAPLHYQNIQSGGYSPIFIPVVVH